MVQYDTIHIWKYGEFVLKKSSAVSRMIVKINLLSYNKC